MELPRGGIIGKAAKLVQVIRRMDIPIYAANAGFFMVLSVFPMLVLVLSILRYTRLDAVDLMALLSAYIPRALQEPVEKLVIQTYAYSGAAIVSVSAVGALWSAGRGIYGILGGLNAVYDAPEDRGWLHTRLICMLYTAAFLLVVVLGLALNVFGEYLMDQLRGDAGLWRLLSGLVDMRFLLLLLVQTVLFAAMYAVLPNRPNRFRDSIPGAVLASFGWLVFSELFSLYVEHWGGYSNIYGSVYALALGMLWLYCCLSILFFGAAINRMLEERM